ncbi:VOC family protein [Nocardia sp. NPDC088792]|uniref:VOC family protein n=1 Tax=Nocardia sp. NPDC088792 TaxID=3364332 RepID=UPI0038018A06
MTTPRLGAIALDTDDPIRLGRFYRELLGLETIHESEDLVALQADGIFITIERVLDHHPPDWPNSTIPKQLHLDLFVDDLDSSEKIALELGARKPETQPAPHKWRVLLDPAGHPFCLTPTPPSM